MTKLVRYGLTPGEMREWEQYCNDEPALKKVQQQVEKREARRAQFHRTTRLVIKWTATAAAVVATCFVIIGKRTAKSKQDVPLPAPVIASSPAHLPPGGGKATLSFTTGEQIRLDGLMTGRAVQTSFNEIIKDDTGHIYCRTTVTDKIKAINNGQPPVLASLETSEDGQFRITLPDGSDVWLNRASTLRFPPVFAGPRREVEITGEAYFEIAKNTAQPFVVRKIGGKDGLNIDVLGTSFNVSAYPGSSNIVATLVSGKISVAQGHQKKILSPGQQLLAGPDGVLMVRNNISTGKIIDWTHDEFVFSKDSLREVLHRLSGWYKVDIQIPATLADQLIDGTLPRSLSLENALESISNHQKNFKYTRLENHKMIITQ